MQFDTRIRNVLLRENLSTGSSGTPTISDGGAALGDSIALIPAPDRESVARLAYHYWQERGRPEGCGDEDWFRAEHDLASGLETI